MQLDCPSAGWYWPPPHPKQLACPVESWYWPGSQARLGMGVGATVGRRVVVGATVGLGEGAGVGRKHWSAEPAPTAEQLPTGQSVQTAAPPREYLAQVRSMHVEV